MRLFGWNIEFYNPRRHTPQFSGVDHFFTGDRCLRPFATADVQAILMMISNRMANVVWSSDPEYDITKRLFDFLHRNAFAILLRFFYEGYVAIDMTEPFRPVFAGEVDRDCDWYRNDDRFVVVLDEVYRTTGKTRAQVLAPHIELLNTVNDSDLNLILNYGAMGILSPESTARTDGYLDDESKNEIQEEYTKRYGVRFGRWAVLITRTPVKFQRIDLPIKELELPEKRKGAIAEILQYMNIPKELHALFESAKYANRNEAELDMYGNTVTSWAWVFTEIARRCYHNARMHDDKNIGWKADIEMWFDIVGVPALQEAQWNERRKVREELAAWIELKAAVPERADEINGRINALIDNL